MSMTEFLRKQMIDSGNGLVVEPHDDEDSIKVNGVVLHRSGFKDKYGYVVGENHACRVGYDFTNGGAWVHVKKRELRPWVVSLINNWPMTIGGILGVLILLLYFLFK